MDVIDNARKEGRKNLTEYEAKMVLSRHGIPVVRERLVSNERQCRAAISEIGFPLVIKGCSPGISHKSDLGLVALDIRNEGEAIAAFERMLKKVPSRHPSVLIQQMVQGERELVAGLTRDAQYGPAVMFGLGGVLTEVLSDVVFRLAPFARSEALRMINEIRSREVLVAFRGMEAVDLNVLADILVRVGEIAVTYPEITDLDINPLIISGSTPIAVDAYVAFS